MYESQKTAYQNAQSEMASLNQQYTDLQNKMRLLEGELNEQIQTLTEQNTRLTADLRSAQRQSQEYQARADSWKGLLTGFEQGIRSIHESLQQTRQQLDTAREQGIKDQKELNQITMQLYEKLVQLEALEADRRRLLEQNESLLSRSGTERSTAAQPVTPIPGPARPAVPAPTGADIRGLVTEVEQKMVTLSVGSADGVRKDMVFHVTRGDQFLCNVIVTNVDVNQSAGVLELIAQQPRVGDTASTRL